MAKSMISVLLAGLVLQCDAVALAQVPDASRVTADQVEPQKGPDDRAAKTATSSRRKARSVDLQQIASPGQGAAAPSQLSFPEPRFAAPPSLSTVRQGRTLDAAAVGGRDRCDGEDASASRRACADIPENRPQDFAAPPSDPPTLEQILIASPAASDTVRAGAGPAPALPPSVAGIVAASGAPGGGVTVVTLPPPR